MIVTAEPYFAAKRPSDYIVLYNLWCPNAEEVPLDIYEARNAMRIARQAGAKHYAADALHRALQLLQQAESMIVIGKERDTTVGQEKARQAAEAAENARAMTEQHQQEATAVSHFLLSDSLVSELRRGGELWPSPHNS